MPTEPRRRYAHQFLTHLYNQYPMYKAKGVWEQDALADW